MVSKSWEELNKNVVFLEIRTIFTCYYSGTKNIDRRAQQKISQLIIVGIELRAKRHRKHKIATPHDAEISSF